MIIAIDAKSHLAKFNTIQDKYFQQTRSSGELSELDQEYLSKKQQLTSYLMVRDLKLPI